MRYTATYVIYFAALSRAVAWNQDEAAIPLLVWALLAAYGLLLVSEAALGRRLPWYRWGYPVLQSGLTLTLLSIAPDLDFLPMLFIPVSFQVVQSFGRRRGFLWIGAFTLAMAGPLMHGWDWQLSGLAMVLMYGGLNFLVGAYADWIGRAERSRRENQRLFTELQKAYRQLQEYAMQVEELAAAQERHRLAREMHDSVTQTIFSMNLAVQAARLLSGKNPALAAGQIERLQALAHSAAGELQVLAGQLRDRSPAVEGLEAALQRLAAERAKRDGLQVSLEIRRPAQALPEPVAAGLYRIAQEALNNVAKHAGTRSACLRLDLTSSPAYLEVEDHGCGFETTQAGRSLDHIGLAGMAERARELGWRLDVVSQPGRGTRVRAEEVMDGVPTPA